MSDNDPTYTNVDPSNVDGNKGIVKINYEPYTDMLEKMKALNERVYNLTDYFDRNQEVRIIYPEVDTYYQGNTNKGHEDRLGIKLTTSTSFLREAFIRYDLNELTEHIGDVSFKMFSIRSGDAGTNYKANFVADNSWTETGVTFSQQPAEGYELGRWERGSDVVLDIRNPVMDAIRSTKKLSMKISSVNPTDSQQEYASNEYPEIEMLPRLEIKQYGSADDASLTDLIINNRFTQAFHPDTLIYQIVLPEGTKSNPIINFNKPNYNMTV
ncbi:MAG: DNRLRE domain-containing protein [Paludibacter sp.]|nr:DNRLRE domain-containing protein [Paludibacter sp.]